MADDLAGRRFVRPLLRLAEQAVSRPGLPPRTRLAEAYPSNEIGQLARAFDEIYNQLEQALEHERLFTADVSHELTPLIVIASSAKVLDEEAGLSASARVQAARIRKAAGEMQQHLQAYLMLARGGTGSFTRAGAGRGERRVLAMTATGAGARPGPAMAVRRRTGPDALAGPPCCMSWCPT